MRKRPKSEIRNPKLESAGSSTAHTLSLARRILDFGYRSFSGLRSLALLLCIIVATPLHASTNSIASDEIPPLRPLRAEMGPTFWEQYGAWPVVGGIVLLAIIVAGLWLLLRPRPPVPVAPAVRARHELEPLSQQPETGLVLSRVSQILRHYVAAAFGLPAGEFTTREFCSTITGYEQVGPELSGAMSKFLRECDERKFAPAPPATPLEAVSQASKLIELAEARRAQLAASAPATQTRIP